MPRQLVDQHPIYDILHARHLQLLLESPLGRMVEVFFRPIHSWLAMGRSPWTARAAWLAGCGLARAESMWNIEGLPDDKPGGCWHVSVCSSSSLPFILIDRQEE
jgi:hypothetical protein